MKVLAIGAHPDDVELGAGGILAKHKARGDEVHILIFTKGEAGRGDPEARMREADQSARILKVDSLRILGFPVYEFTSPTQMYIRAIAEQIAKLRPQRIYVHFPGDSHQVHQIVGRCTRIAVKDFIEVRELLYYEQLSSGLHGFNSNAFADISDTLDTKIRCVKAHSSQLGKYGVTVESVIALARLRYHQAGFPTRKDGAAEAFIVGHILLEP